VLSPNNVQVFVSEVSKRTHFGMTFVI